MNNHLFGLVIFLGCVVVKEPTSAATFQNLDFESPVQPIVVLPGFTVSATNLLPGWQIYAGGVLLDYGRYNSVAFSLGEVALLDSDGPLPAAPIEGSFTAYIYSGLVPQVGGPLIPGPVSLVQSGMVPSGSQSLQFLSYGDQLQVSIGGNSLSPVPLSTGSDLILYGADISGFAGQELELRFTAPIDTSRIFPYRTEALLDSIQFSTTPVPEPSTFALFATAAAFGWFYCRRKRR